MKKPNLSVQIIIALFLGVAAGLLFGQALKNFAEIGKLIIQFIKVAAIPLLFFAILNAIVKTDVSRKNGLKMIGIAVFNSTIALSIGLLLSNYFQPGQYLNYNEMRAAVGDAVPKVTTPEKLDIVKTIASYFPTSIVQPFADNAVIPIVILSLLIGFGLRKLKNSGEHVQGVTTIENVLDASLRVTEIILGWMIKLIPLAVFAVVAKSVGEYGLAPFKGLAAYVGVALLGMLLHIIVTYQIHIALVARLNLKRFWKEAREPVVYSIGANSSLATLPVTLRALDRLGVSKSASTLGACVGTNLNNDGIILYEAMAVLFVAQAHGIDMSLTQQFFAALSCLVAAMGVAGIPEAGFISLSLVLVTAGLPVEILPLLLTVDWIVARARSATNVLSDMVVSILIDKKFSK